MELAKEQPPPPPRPTPPVRKIGAGTLFLLTFGGIWGGVGLLLTTIFMSVGGAPWHDWILNSRGQAAMATLVGVAATSARINRVRVQEIEYHFTDATGTEHTGHAGTTDGRVINAARAGTALAVEYDPQCPSRNRLQGTSVSFFGVFLLLPMFFAVVGAGLVSLAVLDMARRRRLYVRGEAVLGKVERVRNTVMRHNRRLLHRVFYRFNTGSGEQTGSFTTVNPPPEGTPIWILYDPAQPTQSLPA